MFKILRNHPFSTSLLILAIYIAIFLLPTLFVTPDPDQHGLTGVQDAIGQWKAQLIFIVFFVVVISLLGWWREVGFRAPSPGGLKFLVPPVLFALLLLYASSLVTQEQHWFLAFDSPQQMIALALVMLGVGFTEEAMFRGILFHGFETRFSPLLTVLGVAVIFGVFHFLNLLGGAGFYDTTYQVIHAAAAGFMYATLRLMVGAIWPVMLFHGFWDFSVFTGMSMKSAADRASDSATFFSTTHALLIILPALLYGIFVYWRWSVRARSTSTPQNA